MRALRLLWRLQRFLVRALQEYKARPAIAAALVDTDELIEEETMQHYNADDYYPIRIGQVFRLKYRVVAKLGYGAYSTVWLCRNIWSNTYSVLKLSTQKKHLPVEWRDRELTVYKHLSGVKSTHIGQYCVRELWDAFKVSGPYGDHTCLIQPVMHMTCREMMTLRSKKEPLPLPMVRLVAKMVLSALDYLHTEAHVVHCDIRSDNIMLAVFDHVMFAKCEKAERKQPAPRKVVDKSRSIYMSRTLGMPRRGYAGLPRLCDLGDARIGLVHDEGMFVQPHQYRAPEVIFEIPWGPPIDIWNLAVLIWELVEGKVLFRNVFDSDREYDPYMHLALIAGLVGPPPPELLQTSETAGQCFDSQGNWIASQYATVPEISLEELETQLEDDDKEQFLRFIRSMLVWEPEKRKTAKELLSEPWVNIVE